MDEYISKKQAVDLLKILPNPYNLPSLHTIGMAIDFIKNQPAADVQSVKHGRWIGVYEYCEIHNLRPSGLAVYHWCSKCDKAEKKTSDFCPNCGARMDGGSYKNDI